MAQVLANTQVYDDVTFVKLAREVAIGLNSIETILKHHQITQTDWDYIREHPRFLQYLEQEQATWESALNTQERVKIKSASMIEQWLPDAFDKMIDKNEPLSGRLETAKLVSRLAGMGVTGFGVSGETSEKFSVTINLGADNAIKIEKETTPKVIEGEMVNG